MNKNNFLSMFNTVPLKTKGANGFLDFNISQYEDLLKKKSEGFWVKSGEKQALRVFHQAAKRVPAYKDFLKINKIRPESIKNIQDFTKVPTTDKKNYIQKYSIKDRSWDGKMPGAKIIALSSGATGEPSFWPRGELQEFEASVIHELIYKYLFKIDKNSSLLVIGFPMGIYVSGVATLLPSWLISQKGYDLSIASVGTSRDEIIRVVKKIGDSYQQIILVGHPFFIKDVIETGEQKGIQWKKKKVKAMFCSEGFSEEWRDYVVKKIKANKKEDPVISTYGSSEMLLMAHETPASIRLKKKMELENRGKQFNGVFQYNPLLRYIENIDNELVFTSASGVPLVRYNLRDTGKILSVEEVEGRFNIKNIKWQLPFLCLGERSDSTIVFYAANIYPDHIRQALDHKPFLDKITGKFVMRKDYTKNKDEFLEINVELRKNVKSISALQKRIQKQIVENLKKNNAEYLFLWNNLKKDIKPKIRLRRYQHEKYFKPGLKPRYIEK